MQNKWNTSLSKFLLYSVLVWLSSYKRPVGSKMVRHNIKNAFGGVFEHLIEHVIRLHSINLCYFNLLFISYPKALLMVTSSIIQYSKTLLIEFHQNRILMRYILNVTKRPPDCMLRSYWKLMSRPYLHHILWHWIHIHVYQFPTLPNLVSPITELTSQLDPHWKSVLNAFTYVPV